jgi:hypothetical protein
MEVYKSETKEVLSRFLDRRLSFPDCIAALDAALAGLLPRLHPDELPALRELMLANNAIVMKEMERRGKRRKPKANAPAANAPPQEAAIPSPLATLEPLANLERVHNRLERDLKAASERAAAASAAFLAVTSQVPSGLPHPDGTQRIRNISHELTFARTELMRAHSRLDAFLVSGVAPDDLVSGGE